MSFPISDQEPTIDVYCRVAVLLLDRFEFATNTNRLLGRGQVQQRHLEIMGYKVVQVSTIIKIDLSTKLSFFKSERNHLYLFG